ncbi:uncharacterized protein DDB_G0287625-like, partial [Agrilus planipennis]|uniref:Uncharacterized protein DDB_G0287625-like n=1 Tax=Agrilus planipennis TaxID=224129 RepID=A0A7F5RIF3_AGRPL
IRHTTLRKSWSQKCLNPAQTTINNKRNPNPNYSHLYQRTRNTDPSKTETFLGEITIQSPADLPEEFNGKQPPIFENIVFNHQQNAALPNPSNNSGKIRNEIANENQEVNQNLDYADNGKQNGNGNESGESYSSEPEDVEYEDYIDEEPEAQRNTEKPRQLTTTTQVPITTFKRTFVRPTTTEKQLHKSSSNEIKAENSNAEGIAQEGEDIILNEEENENSKAADNEETLVKYEDDEEEQEEPAQNHNNNNSSESYNNLSSEEQEGNSTLTEGHVELNYTNHEQQGLEYSNTTDEGASTQNKTIKKPYEVLTMKPSSLVKDDNFKEFIDSTGIDNTSEIPQTELSEDPNNLSSETKSTAASSLNEEVESSDVDTPPVLLGAAVVSVVTTKSVINKTIIDETPLSYNAKEIRSLEERSEEETTPIPTGSGENATEEWIVVASVHTSRSVSGARYLPFPTVEQEERTKLLNEGKDISDESFTQKIQIQGKIIKNSKLKTKRKITLPQSKKH